MTEYDYIDVDTGERLNIGNKQSPQTIPLGNGPRTDKADLLDKIRPERAVELIRHKLQGEEYNPKTGVWELNPIYKNRLKPEGAQAIANLMLSVSTQNTSISNLDDKEIKKRVLHLCKTAQYMLLENWFEYGITSKAQMYFVHEIIFTNALVVLKQPQNEGIRKLLSNTIQEQRSYVQQEEKQGGLFGLFRRRN